MNINAEQFEAEATTASRQHLNMQVETSMLNAYNLIVAVQLALSQPAYRENPLRGELEMMMKDMANKLPFGVEMKKSLELGWSGNAHLKGNE